jgi:hypothetical protein
MISKKDMADSLVPVRKLLELLVTLKDPEARESGERGLRLIVEVEDHWNQYLDAMSSLNTLLKESYEKRYLAGKFDDGANGPKTTH